MQDLERQYERLLDQYQNGDLSRRHFLTRLGQGAALCGLSVPFLSGCSPAKDSQSVRFDGFGGVVQQSLDDNLFRPFTKETDIRVVQSSFANSDELMTRIQAESIDNFGYCEFGSTLDAERFDRRGWLADIDPARIPRLADLVPKSVESYRTKNGMLRGVPVTMTGITIGYNENHIDRTELEEKGVNILLDPQYSDVRVGEDNWIKRIWYAALQSGQDPNAIEDMDAVWEKVRESRASVFKYWRTGAEQMQLFASGSAWLSDAWIMRIHALAESGQPIRSYRADGLFLGFAAIAAFKSAPLDPLYEMMDILLRPEVLTAVALQRGTPPALDPRKHSVPAEIRKMPGFDPTGEFATAKIMDPVYWTENAEEWRRTYRRIIAQG